VENKCLLICRNNFFLKSSKQFKKQAFDFLLVKCRTFYTILWHTSLHLVGQHLCSLQWFHRVASKQKGWLQHQLKNIITIGVVEKEGKKKTHLGPKSLLHEGGQKLKQSRVKLCLVKCA
jgi:hypothetical protein